MAMVINGGKMRTYYGGREKLFKVGKNRKKIEKGRRFFLVLGEESPLWKPRLRCDVKKKIFHFVFSWQTKKFFSYWQMGIYVGLKMADFKARFPYRKRATLKSLGVSVKITWWYYEIHTVLKSTQANYKKRLRDFSTRRFFPKTLRLIVLVLNIT